MKNDPMKLVATKYYGRGTCCIKVYQNSKTTFALLYYTGPIGKKDKFYGKASRSDEDEFDSVKGIDLAVARAKKSLHEYVVKIFVEKSKSFLRKANTHLKEVESLAKTHGLNRDARKEGENYTAGVYKIFKIKEKQYAAN